MFAAMHQTQSFEFVTTGADRWVCARHLESSTAPYVRESWVTGLVFGSQSHGRRGAQRVADPACRALLVRLASSRSRLRRVTEDTRKQLAFKLAPNPSRQTLTLRVPAAANGGRASRHTDAQGRRIREVARERLAAGTYMRSWDGDADDGSNAAPGVYFARLESSTANSVLRVHTLAMNTSGARQRGVCRARAQRSVRTAPASARQ